MNQGLESIGSATPLVTYIDSIYRPTVLPLLASSTRSNYDGILRKRLVPLFGDYALRDLNTMTLQKYFSGLQASHSTAMKIKDVLSSVLGSAVRFQMLVRNPIDGIQILLPRTGKRAKPHITPEQFELLVNGMSEPYATMVYVCVMSGLRVSELIGLKWDDILPDALVIDERYCRGDWGCPKTSGSGATIGVDPRVIARIHRLKAMEVTINWGAKGTRTFKAVRADGPKDLVFQPLCGGRAMDDHNILSRHIKPTARLIGLPWVNWQVLRRSYGTWMVEAGADPKAVQAQMRHSRISTTMDIYAQFVPAAQKRAVAQMSQMIDSRRSTQEEARVMS
jgi:integrase